MSETEHGIVAYDLEPPGSLSAICRPMPHPGTAPPRPRWVPPPVPEGCARVELDDDYYTGTYFSDWTGGTTEYPARIFDIPREQHDRWVAARDAYAAMQEEVEALTGARQRASVRVPDGWMEA